jgi:hypothetical protein
LVFELIGLGSLKVPGFIKILPFESSFITISNASSKFPFSL